VSKDVVGTGGEHSKRLYAEIASLSSTELLYDSKTVRRPTGDEHVRGYVLLIG
jgi:hypothetical protein